LRAGPDNRAVAECRRYLFGFAAMILSSASLTVKLAALARDVVAHLS
jgi:hypothetical protein